MAAPTRIDWTHEAQDQLAQIHRYLQERWSDRIAERFLHLVMDFEALVLRYPNGFPASLMHPELRMGMIHRNVKAVYRVDPGRILVITLLDSRADNTSWF